MTLSQNNDAVDDIVLTFSSLLNRLFVEIVCGITIESCFDVNTLQERVFFKSYMRPGSLNPFMSQATNIDGYRGVILMDVKDKYFLLEERRTSKSYKIAGRYRKYYKYATIDQAEYESKMQILFLTNGIKTPHCYGHGFDKEKKAPYIECEYIKLRKIKPNQLLDSFIREKIYAIINKIRLIKSTEYNEIKETSYYNDLRSSFGYIDDDSIIWNDKLTSLQKQKEKYVCHGDFTLENLGFDDEGDIMLFDYQHVAMCNENWDLAFFIASLPYEIGYTVINSIDIKFLDMIRLAAAVRYGRGLRKNYEVDNRMRIYNYWKGYKICD